LLSIVTFSKASAAHFSTVGGCTRVAADYANVLLPVIKAPTLQRLSGFAIEYSEYRTVTGSATGFCDAVA